MMNDPIADMLTRIRNANSIGRASVDMPASKMKVGIAEVLKNEGFIASYEVEEGTPFSTLKLELKYGPDGEKVLRTIERVSKPGCRTFTGVKDMKPVLNGMGVLVISSPKGVVSDRTARDLNVGGEVLCKVC